MWQRYKITYLYTLSGIRTSPRFNATKRVDVGGAVAVGVGGVDIGVSIPHRSQGNAVARRSPNVLVSFHSTNISLRYSIQNHRLVSLKIF